jgi:hypothetical protein
MSEFSNPAIEAKYQDLQTRALLATSPEWGAVREMVMLELRRHLDLIIADRNPAVVVDSAIAMRALLKMLEPVDTAGAEADIYRRRLVQESMQRAERLKVEMSRAMTSTGAM